jgi:hypothetical protein
MDSKMIRERIEKIRQEQPELYEKFMKNRLDYELNFRDLVASVGTIDHEFYVQRERALNSKDERLREAIGISIGDPCRFLGTERCQPYDEAIGKGCDQMGDEGYCARFDMYIVDVSGASRGMRKKEIVRKVKRRDFS